MKTQDSEISLEKRYELIREQIRHEDGLINQRLNWLLFSQGFLFAAFTSIWSASNSSAANPVGSLNILGPVLTHWVVFGIPLTGLVLNYLSYMGLEAAYESLGYLRQNWRDARPTAKQAQKLYDSFPKITHGRPALTTASGTPIVISIVWLALALPFNMIGWWLAPVALLFIYLLLRMGYTTWKNMR